MTVETIEHAFTVRAPARLSLANMRGSVEITAGELDTIEIQTYKHLDTGDAENTQVIIRQADNGDVSAETRFEVTGWFSLPAVKPCKVDYRVRVPQACNLRIKGVSNSTSIEGISGEIEISTVSGSLKLVDLAGPLQVKSVSGDISGEKIAGQLALETVSGDLLLTDSNLAHLNASTVSGDLSIHSLMSSNPVQLKSVSGDVLLYVPAQTGYTISSQSISGSVVTSLPVTQRQKSLGQSQVKISGGGTSILHRSISGDLILKENGQAGADAPVVEAEQNTPDHMEMLERIERGELTVEEALHTLQPEAPVA